MKITIYDLLGMIKDGKAPKKIKVTGTIYEYDEESKFYFAHFKKYSVALGGKEDEINLLYNVFNKNVEILDKAKKDKIEKIDVAWQNVFDEQAQQDFAKMTLNKINELIDEVNKLKENKCIK